jgi:hypothetical protein
MSTGHRRVTDREKPKLTTPNQQNAQNNSLDISITLNIYIRFDPQGTISREQNQSSTA